MTEEDTGDVAPSTDAIRDQHHIYRIREVLTVGSKYCRRWFLLYYMEEMRLR